MFVRESLLLLLLRQNHSTTSHWCSVGLSCDDWGWRTLAQWTDCGVQDSTLIWLNTVSYPSASIAIRKWWTWSAATLGDAVVFKPGSTAAKGPRESPRQHHTNTTSYQPWSEATFFPISYCHVICSLAICIHKPLNVRLIKFFLLAIFAFFFKV